MVSRFVVKPGCAENLALCQHKAPCSVFVNTEDLIDSPRKQSAHEKTNRKEIKDTITPNKEEESIDEAGLVSRVDKGSKPPKSCQTDMDKDPVRITLLDDIEKEAERQNIEQKIRIPKSPTKDDIQGKSTALQQYQTYMLYLFVTLNRPKNL
eukprot:5704848-Ditylum_brightwellii.AAC.1